MLFVWGPYTSVFERLRREMNSLFDRRFFGRGVWPTGLEREGKFPHVNMAETAEGLAVTCELPGVEKDDIDISVEGGVLTIRGERKPPEDRPSERYYRRERGFGPFERAIELPSKVDVDNIRAKLTSGVLALVLPKHPDAKPKRIEVNVE